MRLPAPTRRSLASAPGVFKQVKFLRPYRAFAIRPTRGLTSNAVSSSSGVDEPFNVLFVGAGNINFGGSEGVSEGSREDNEALFDSFFLFLYAGRAGQPWDHSRRLEEKLGARYKVVGIIDPNSARVDSVLQKKQSSIAAQAYASAASFRNVSEARSALGADGAHAIIVGTPPSLRGTTDPSQGHDVELQLVNAFPQAGLMVEKPVSTKPIDEVKEVATALVTRDNLIGVGYMLRYSRAVQKILEIMSENRLTPMMVSARYVMAYEYSLKPAWWDKSIDCGPIVEQATHFCDLARYIGGEIDMGTVHAHALEWYDRPGQLSKLGIDESKIPEQERIPRFTSASWRFENGAVGHLEHGVALHGSEFYTELTVYNRPTLYVRRPGSDREERYEFDDDDPFYSEISSFVDAIASRRAGTANATSANPSLILSSYEDAVKTAEMTWAIRWASEKESAKRRSNV